MLDEPQRDLDASDPRGGQPHLAAYGVIDFGRCNELRLQLLDLVRSNAIWLR